MNETSPGEAPNPRLNSCVDEARILNAVGDEWKLNDILEGPLVRRPVKLAVGFVKTQYGRKSAGPSSPGAQRHVFAVRHRTMPAGGTSPPRPDSQKAPPWCKTTHQPETVDNWRAPRRFSVDIDVAGRGAAPLSNEWDAGT